MYDDKIVLFGMSCSGKTTFAKQLKDHHYYCFDEFFPWHQIETLNLSTSHALKNIECIEDKYVLDGWHLSDKEGKFLPEGSSVYVVYADYDLIINQYRVEVQDRNQHKSMFKKWYQDIDYSNLSARYILNTGFEFIETTEKDYFSIKISTNCKDI